ncbi:MAG: PAS domain S-box protein [Betaproteobacteria bacterium]|nr:PAS domain S-box protein [Betaproteobacteria bacterium]
MTAPGIPSSPALTDISQSIDRDHLNRLIANSGNDCMLVLSADGRIQQVGESTQRLLELSDPAQLHGVNWLSIWEAPERAAVRDAIIGARQGKTVRFSAFGYTLKRTPKWWDIVVSLVDSPGGTPKLLLAVVRDVTELHLREQQIRELNSQLEQRVEQRTQDLIRANYQLHNALLQVRDLYDHAPCGYLSLDRQGCFVEANQTTWRWLGLVQSEAISERDKLAFHSLLSPSDADRFDSLYRWVLAGHKTEEEAFDISRKDGSFFTALINATPVLDFEGRFVNCRMSMVDITARRQAETALQRINNDLEQAIRERSSALVESEERFRLMVEGIADYGIYFTDANGCITSWSTSAQSLHGYHAQEALGQDLSQVMGIAGVPQDGDAPPLSPLAQARSQGHYEAYDWVKRKDGSRFWGHSVIMPLRDATRPDDQQLLGFACLVHDLSEIRKTQDLQQNLNAELEHRVQERTQQLKAVNAELEGFSYTVSHDLRAPLRHIHHYIEMGMDAANGPEGVQALAPFLNHVLTSTHHMGKLIDGLLDLARLGRTALREMPVPMGELVQELVKVQHAQAQRGPDGQKASGVDRVEWVVATDWPTVPCDPVLVRQVWNNLLSNALKYSRKRDIVRIEVGNRRRDDGLAEFFVSDNGVGFDPKFREKLFGMFQRLHSETEFEGTGIGLALTRKIVERHGGSIWAEGEKNVGCTISFTLPLISRSI